MTSAFLQQERLIKLRELLADDNIGGWDNAWTKQITPWDAGETQPPLEELYRNHEIKFPRGGRALVPGCGMGYDAITIAKNLNLQVTAMDVSSTAIKMAKENLENHPALSSNISFEEGDFFTLRDEPTFELVSDYTFFQAFPIKHRPAWGAKMRSIVKPGGLLVVLAFPTDASKDFGPPFGIDGDTHSSLLGDGWVKLLDRVPSTSSEAHVGRERLMVFQKQRH